MAVTQAGQRIALSPTVQAILEADSPQAHLLRDCLRYLEALLAGDPAGIERVVTPDVRCHELEALGLPRGPEGLQLFRRQVNAAIPDEHIFINAVRFEGDDIIDAALQMTATHSGEAFMGIPATGQKLRFEVRARNRFVDGKLVERWDQVDFKDIRRQLTGSTQ